MMPLLRPAPDRLTGHVMSGLLACSIAAAIVATAALRAGAQEAPTQIAAVADSESSPIDRFSKGGAALWLRTAEAAPAAEPPAAGPVMIPAAASPDAAGEGSKDKAEDHGESKSEAVKANAPAKAKQPAKHAEGKDAAAKPKLTRPVKSGGLAQQYCVNISDAAADARFAWQAKTIADFEKELDARIKVLEAKTEEYKKWLDRRNDFVNRAHQKLVDIYTKMKPDAVALQMANLDEETAAAVVFRLEPRVASSILNEMDPEKAARISALIARSAVTSAAKPGAQDGRS